MYAVLSITLSMASSARHSNLSGRASPIAYQCSGDARFVLPFAQIQDLVRTSIARVGVELLLIFGMGGESQINDIAMLPIFESFDLNDRPVSRLLWCTGEERRVKLYIWQAVSTSHSRSLKSNVTPRCDMYSLKEGRYLDDRG
jgi:hypothetical protein